MEDDSSSQGDANESKSEDSSSKNTSDSSESKKDESSEGKDDSSSTDSSKNENSKSDSSESRTETKQTAKVTTKAQTTKATTKATTRITTNNTTKSTTKAATKSTTKSTTKTTSNPNPGKESYFMQEMYRRGLVPKGTYSGTRVFYHNEYGLCIEFHGKNKNGGSGKAYTFNINNFDSACDCCTTFTGLMQKKAQEVWDSKKAFDTTGNGMYTMKDAYAVAAVMNSDYQFYGIVPLPMM